MEIIFANDSGGMILPTGSVQFVKQENIEMQQEALFLSSDKIIIDYLFKNASDKDITTTIIFPLPDMACYELSMGTDHNFDFKVWVNGKEIDYNTHLNIFNYDTDITKEFSSLFKNYYTLPTIKDLLEHCNTLSYEEREKIKLTKDGMELSLGEITQLGPNEYFGFPCAMKVYFYWEQSFPRGKIVNIRHTYRPSSEFVSNGSASFEYILKTANTWKMPIKQFNLLVKYIPGYRKGNVSVNYFSDSRYDSSKYPSRDFTSAGDLGKQYEQQYYIADIKNFTPAGDLYISEKSRFFENYCSCEDNLGYKGCILYSEKDKKTPKCFFKESPIEGEADIYPWFKAKYPLSGYFEVKKRDSWLDIICVKDIPKGLPVCKVAETIEPKLNQIDGPANLRDKPNGKKTHEVEDKIYVWAVAKDGDWYQVITENFSGWTHKQNLIDIFADYDK